MAKKRYPRVQVTSDELFDTVTDRNGCTFIGLRTKYIPSHFEQWNQRGRWMYEMPYWGNIYCYSEVACLIGINYENNVNNAREKQGLPRNFTQSGERWGPNYNHVNAAVIVDRRDETRRYLQVRVQSRSYDYRRIDNNRRIPIEEIQDWLTPEMNQNGVVLRRFKFSSLVNVVMRTNSDSRSRRYILN